MSDFVTVRQPGISEDRHRIERMVLLRRHWIFAALNPAAAILNIENRIDDLALTDMVKHRLKELLLSGWRDVRNDDDEARMDGSTIIEREEIYLVVGYEGIVAFEDHIHQLPILRAPEPEIGNMVRRITGGMGQFNQRSVQTLVNEEFCQAQTAEGRCLVVRIGFFFAHGRCAGRPRRGNAVT